MRRFNIAKPLLIIFVIALNVFMITALVISLKENVTFITR